MLTWELVNKSRSLSLRSIGASTASLMLCAELLLMSMMMISFCEIPTCPQGQWPTWREALQLTKVGSQDEPFHTILLRRKF